MVKKKQVVAGSAPAAPEAGAPENSGPVWGINPVLEALRQTEQGVHEVLVLQGKAGPRLQEIIDLARTRGIPLRFVPAQHLGVPQGCRHQGVAARLAAANSLDLGTLLAEAAAQPLLVLDCIQDPHNLGSIFRSALAAGFSRIILPRERSAIIGGTVAQSSAGALSHLRLCRVGNIAETLQTLKQHGYWIYGAVADPRARSLYSAQFPDATCLVIGGEGKGIRPLVQKRCDELITIPMAANFNSLNAAVAAAVIMFEVVRRRGALGGQAQL